MKTLRCNYYVNPENTSWRGLLTNLNDKKRNLMRKSHTIIQSLNIVPIDKPKSSIATILVTLWKKKKTPTTTLKKTTLKKTILKRTILEKKPISVPGEIKRIPFNIKRENVNNFVKQIDEIPFSPNFINFRIHLTDSGSSPRKYG